MANQDANIETNDNKRIINISMKIELKNSESDKKIQELLENVTREAIDVALTATNTLNQTNQKKSNETTTDNIEMTRLRSSLDDKNLQNNKYVNVNATSSIKIASESTSGTEKNETLKKERKVTNIETYKGVETDAMKKIRRSLEIKNSKKNKNDNSNANSSFDGSTCISGKREIDLTRPKETKDSKETTNKSTHEYVSKPSIETEAMKRIRRSLELKSKTKRNNNVTATISTCSPSSSTRTCQSIGGTGITKSPGKGSKRKIADVGLDKTHVETEEMKRMKLRNSGQNENYSCTPNTTSEITYEQMDVDDVENDDSVPTVISTGSKKTSTLETRGIIKKAGVENEAMKMIRRRLELKKNKLKSTSTINITASRPSATRLVKDYDLVRSPKTAKRKTATDKPTRIKELIEQSRKSRESETSNATTFSTPRETNTETAYDKIRHENKSDVIVQKSNIIHIETTGEITEDEDDSAVFKAGFNNVHSETAEYDKSSSTSISSYQSAMNVEVEQDDNTAAKRTRSKTWARRVWKK